MKLRLLAMGTIISILGLALLARVGVRAQFAILFGVGIAILVAGLVWKQPSKRLPPSDSTSPGPRASAGS
jgi:hypothetical protein